MTTCTSCAKELPDDARFCLQCGTPIATPSTPAEYKQVTVLFADVVRSMDIAAAVGAERLREIMAELLDCSTAVVKRYGGTVNQFTGDGIMAVFGAPVTLGRTMPFAPASRHLRFKRRQRLLRSR
jgi:adenylate cyclase